MRFIFIICSVFIQFYANSQIVHFDYNAQNFKEIIQIDSADEVLRTSDLFKNIIEKNVDSIVININDSIGFGTIDCFRDGQSVYGDFVRVAYISNETVVLIIHFGYDARKRSKTNDFAQSILINLNEDLIDLSYISRNTQGYKHILKIVFY